MKNSVAIIGAGPGGLVTAKEMLEARFDVSVFEARGAVGGVWRDKTWQTMRSLLSRFHAGFSDLPMAEGVGDFPSAGDVLSYLQNYADHFRLQPHIRYNQTASVTYQNGWRVTTPHETKQFDFVVNASGVFARPHVPSFKNLSQFRGKIMHSQDYKHGNQIGNGPVAVIGGSYSAYEICADLAQHGVACTHVFRQPSWIIPPYAMRNSKLVPFDLVSYTYAAPSELSPQQRLQRKLDHIESSFGNPGDTHKDLRMHRNTDAPPTIVISDTYLPGVKNGGITPHKGAINHFTAGGLCVSGQEVHAQTVILCTGFLPHSPIADAGVNAVTAYQPQNRFLAYELNKGTLHPDVPNLGFVGQERGPYFATMEMQARWLAQAFSGQCVPSPQSQQDALNESAALRALDPQPPFPRGDYVGYMLALAQEIGVVPTALLQSSQPMLPGDFRLCGPGAKPAIAETQRHAIQQRLD